MWSQLKGYWDEVRDQLPQIRDHLNTQISNISHQLAPLGVGGIGGSGEVVTVGPRSLRVLKKIGEGGYSFVYLAEEVLPAPAPRRPQHFALKKVLADSEEQLAAARHEIAVMRRLTHPNILPLVDAAIVRSAQTSSAGHVAYMLFPLYVSRCGSRAQNVGRWQVLRSP